MAEIYIIYIYILLVHFKHIFNSNYITKKGEICGFAKRNTSPPPFLLALELRIWMNKCDRPICTTQCIFGLRIREAAKIKNKSFIMPFRPYPPSPLELNGRRHFFLN